MCTISICAFKIFTAVGAHSNDDNVGHDSNDYATRPPENNHEMLQEVQGCYYRTNDLLTISNIA